MLSTCASLLWLLSSRIDSFNSAFQLLRNGHTPYFYVCASQMTFLFRAKDAGAEDVSRSVSVEILISPTTKGFRDTLTAEGVFIDGVVLYSDVHVYTCVCNVLY